MNEIRMYIKDKKNQKVGILIGINTPSGVVISGSKVRKGVDTFDRDIGYQIAMRRLYGCQNKGRKIKLPISMADDVAYFTDRCQRYFKTDNIVRPVFKPFVTSCGSC